MRPGSIMPHPYFPGLVKLESRLPQDTGDKLKQLGHKVEWWPERNWLAGSPCMIVHDLARDLRVAGADHRRTSYALGW